MTVLVSRLVPPGQLLVVHAPLGRIEWPGTMEHIERTIPPGVPLILAQTASGKSLLERIEQRGRFPDSRRRFCTSDTYGERTIDVALAIRSLWRVAAPIP